MAEGEDGHARPMTAQLEDELYDDGEYHGPVWFFTSTDNALYQMIQQAELANTNPARWRISLQRATICGRAFRAH